LTIAQSGSINNTAMGESVPKVTPMMIVIPTESSYSGNTTLSGRDVQTEEPELPIDMRFNDGHLLSVIVYSILMVFSAIGNLSVLTTIIK